MTDEGNKTTFFRNRERLVPIFAGFVFFPPPPPSREKRMSERSTFPPAGSASPARFRALGMGCVCPCLLAFPPGGTANAGTMTVPPPAMDAQKWLCRPGWNIMCVTRRGPGVPAEWFSCDISSHLFCVKLR